MMKFILVVCILVGCGKERKEGATLPASQNLAEFTAKAQEVEERMMRDFTQDGWLVSYDTSGMPVGLGDSLIFTTIAMGVVSCENAAKIMQALGSQLVMTGGAFQRFNPLPQEYVGGREVSYDGETGAMFGWTMAVRRCPALRGDLGDLWNLHRSFVLANDGRLHPSARDASLVPGLDYAWDYVGHEFGLRGEPHKNRLIGFEAALLGWAQAVKSSKAACYRVHLGLLHTLTLAKLGAGISKPAKEKFCAITRNMDMPLTDWFCERGDPRSWLSSFEYDKWEYRHQRCGAWESPDSRGRTPGLDFLVLYNLAKE